MVELLENFPSYVVAYKASGIVDADEYEKIVMKRVDEVAQKYDAINLIVRLETGMQNYTLNALLDYLKISFKHIRRWNRMAIVSDQKTVRLFYDALSPLVPGKVQGFTLDDYDKAAAWVSEPFLTDENRMNSPKP
ncbi:STAS/SEC14 domain-containing protein [Bdellovibrio bacteriovorus]|uniref:STAS/SEC14 domain-containing protein n=1 Tax=Bdellovibrio bacteriovorus TaxID=959 RepID=UPI0035A61946